MARPRNFRIISQSVSLSATCAKVAPGKPHLGLVVCPKCFKHSENELVVLLQYGFWDVLATHVYKCEDCGCVHYVKVSADGDNIRWIEPEL